LFVPATAKRQAETARNTLRLHLFDRRFAAFEAAMKLVLAIGSKVYEGFLAMEKAAFTADALRKKTRN
jgi:hypothetical protein